MCGHSLFPQSSKVFCFTNALQQLTLPFKREKKYFSYFREQTKIHPIMSVMHQIPCVAMNLVSPLKLEGDTVNIFNSQGHWNGVLFFPVCFSVLVFLSSLSSSVCFKRLCCWGQIKSYILLMYRWADCEVAVDIMRDCRDVKQTCRNG